MADIDQNNGNHDNGQNYDDQEEVSKIPFFSVNTSAATLKTSSIRASSYNNRAAERKFRTKCLFICENSTFHLFRNGVAFFSGSHPAAIFFHLTTFAGFSF